MSASRLPGPQSPCEQTELRTNTTENVTFTTRLVSDNDPLHFRFSGFMNNESAVFTYLNIKYLP